jgi:ribosomal protein S24E
MVDVQITKEKRNDLFGRKEITAIASTEKGATPSRAELTKALAQKTGKAEDHIEIETINQKFGKQEAEIVAKVWDKPPVKKAAKEAKPAEAKKE